MKSILFLISHPAHFHMFRNTIAQLQQRGHDITVVIRPKDVLEQLCINAGMPYLKVEERPKEKGIVKLGIRLLEKTHAVDKIVQAKHYDMLIGSDGALAWVGWWRHIPSFEFFEDDVEVIKLYAQLFFPFYTNIVCPNVCHAGRWEKKKIGYDGYQKLTYLHPNWFTPSENVCLKYGIDTTQPYFLIRSVNLAAHHDVGVHGFNKDIMLRMVDMLKSQGKIYITSEKELPEEFEPYRLKIDPLDIHHIMAFASLYIGDSQSMAVETAMLGTPSIRFSDFAGRISVLEELEHTYQLTFGIPTQEPTRLFDKISELLNMPDRKEVFQERRKRMLNDKIDVTAFWTKWIEEF